MNTRVKEQTKVKSPYYFAIVKQEEVEDTNDHSQPHGKKRKWFSITFRRDTRLPVEDVIDALRAVATLNDWDAYGEGYISQASNFGVGVVQQYAVFKQRVTK